MINARPMVEFRNQLPQWALDGARDGSGTQVGEHPDQLLGFAGLANQAERGHQGEQRGSNSARTVAGQGCGEIGALIITELPQRLPD